MEVKENELELDEEFSEQEILKIKELLQRYPNAILLRTNPKTGNPIVPYEVAKEWE